MTTDLSLINKEINTQLTDPAVVNSLLASTFKNFKVENMKAAMLEGMIRGFQFKDFLEKTVYAIKYGEGYNLVTSIDYNRKIGQKSGIVSVLPPVYETVVLASGVEKIVSCSVTVKKRFADGFIGDFTALVYFDEYTTGANLWKSKPRTMIAKVAEMHALRKACPEELAQSYVEEETDRERAGNAIHVDAITPEKCLADLEACKSLNELRDTWAKVPAQFQSQLNARKEELKLKLSEPVVVPEEGATK